MSNGQSNRRRSPEQQAGDQQLASYDPLIQQRQQMSAARAAEDRSLADLIKLYEGEAGKLQEAQGVATKEMRREAALRMGGQGLRGNPIGAASAAKLVAGEAENIGTRFGKQIRDAARTAAQAKVERAQQAIERITKPGVDVERVSASLKDIVDRTGQSTVNRIASRMGMPGIGQRGNKSQLFAELDKLLETTDDPLAVQLIKRVEANLLAGREALDGMADA